MIRMIQKAAWIGLGCAALLVGGAGIVRAQVTADDFLPPVQGGPTDVKKPEAVKTEGAIVVAATAQDAINAAVDKNKKDQSGGTPSVGAEMVKFPSGMGVVASGAATYRVMDNPTATRLAKRQAYVVAFTVAKKHMAEFLNGLSNEGKETIRQALAVVDTEKESLTNISTKSDESLAQATQMMLRGFVVYEVQDDAARDTVYVSIVSTPKTRGKLARPAPNDIEVDDLREGLNQVIAEVRSGLVPPVGGRVITMRKTGETAFVGFGSSVVRANANAAVQAKLNLEAQKIAAMRAQDALCGMIVGDKTEWAGGVKESMHDDVKEFETAAAGDPLAASEAGVKKLETQRQSFVSKMESTDVYQSARNGILPPGVNVKTWFGDDNDWAFGMAVYVPSASNAAAQTAEDMKNAQIVQPVRRGPNGGDSSGGASGDTKPSSGFKDENNPNVPRPGNDVKPGPSGKNGDQGL